MVFKYTKFHQLIISLHFLQRFVIITDIISFFQLKENSDAIERSSVDASSAARPKQTIRPMLARRGKKAFINPSASSLSSSTRRTRAGKQAEDADKGEVFIFIFFISFKKKGGLQFLFICLRRFP